jgi:hypothetical protein
MIPFAICYNVPVQVKDIEDTGFTGSGVDLLSAAVCLLLIVAFFAGVAWLFAELGIEDVRLPWSP